jgi:hypothetical protein
MAVTNVIVLLGMRNLQMEAVKVGCYYVCLLDGVLRHFQQYFSYIVAVSFIGGGLSVHSFTSSTHVAPCHPVLHVQFPSTLLQSEVLAISHRQVYIAESGIKHQKSINEINQIFKDVISLRLIN